MRKPRRQIPVQERVYKYFERPVEGCWEWKGSTRGGYGTVWQGGRGGRHYPAHRVVYEIAFGLIPAGKLALHRCNNKLCVRPDHIYIGNHSDNAFDAIDAGVWPSKPGRAVPWATGERNANARLTEESVRQIRAMSDRGVSGREIARQLEVSKDTIQRVLRGDSWAHVT